MEDREIIEAIKTDRKEFIKLYDKYYEKILNFAWRRTGSVMVAEDLTAESFYIALCKIDKFVWTHDNSFSSWIYKIAVNQIKKYYNEQGRYQFKSLDSFDEYATNELPDDEMIEAERIAEKEKNFMQIQKAILKLDKKYQVIIDLRYFEKMQYSDISKITGIKESTLKSHLKRAINKLQKELINENGK